MPTNRISRYFHVAPPSASVLHAHPAGFVPAGFVMVPGSLVPASTTLPAVQQLHAQALSAAVEQAREKFLVLMRSLRN